MKALSPPNPPPNPPICLPEIAAPSGWLSWAYATVAKAKQTNWNKKTIEIIEKIVKLNNYPKLLKNK